MSFGPEYFTFTLRFHAFLFVYFLCVKVLKKRLNQRDEANGDAHLLDIAVAASKEMGGAVDTD